MKTSTFNHSSNIATIIVFIMTYGILPIAFWRPIIGFPIFLGIIFWGVMATANEEKTEITTKDNTKTIDLQISGL